MLTEGSNETNIGDYSLADELRDEEEFEIISVEKNDDDYFREYHWSRDYTYESLAYDF
jgi:hypothetical protein